MVNFGRPIYNSRTNSYIIQLTSSESDTISGEPQYLDISSNDIKLFSPDTNTDTFQLFIKNFIQTLYDCYVELEKSMATVQTKKLSKEERIRRIILESMIPLSKKDIWSMIPDVSMTMIELVLSNLLKAKLILKYGSFKDAKYKRTS
jgi:hypothetical protein